MSILASTIDWNQVGEGKVEIKARHLARFRAIGGFFQTYELPKVMTWETIKAALPKLGGTNPEKIQFIRTSLFQLGELLAESGEMEQWSRYLFRGQRDRLLARCPPCFRDHITGFFTWRANSMLNANIERSQLPVELVSHAPRILIETTASVVRFLAFCADRKATALTDIGPDLVHAYEDFAWWGLECKLCHHCPSNRRTAGDNCSKCGAGNAYVRTRRLARSTVVHKMTEIRFFFDWAQLKKLIPASPFKGLSYPSVRSFTVRGDDGQVTEVANSLRVYNAEVVERLCAHVVSPETNAEEALALYLIIFHLLTNTELRSLRVPSLVEKDVNPDDDLKYLHLPLREPTIGHRALSRTDTKIVFPRKALPWLTTILSRYYLRRARLLTGTNQPHLFVGHENNKSGSSVSKHYIIKLVRDASLRALGEIVTPSDLRRTAAHIFSERSKKRGAVLTEMGFSSLSATLFNYRERFTIVPKRPASEAAA